MDREELRRKLFGQNNEQSNISSVNPELLRLFPPSRLERIKKKDLRKYKTAIDKKYSNWMEAVSR